MAVDCDAADAGVQSDCTYAMGDSFLVQVHVTEAITGNYTGFQSKLRWTDGTITYAPTGDPVDEALWAHCEFALRSINVPTDPSALWGCVPAFSDPVQITGDDFTGAVLEMEFACPGASTGGGGSAPPGTSVPAGSSDVTSALDLVPRVNPDDAQLGSHFLDLISAQVDPILSNASVTCSVGGGAGPTATPPGGGIGPTALPSTGIESISSDDGMNGRIWVITGVLLAAGIAGLAVYGWRHTRSGSVG